MPLGKFLHLTLALAAGQSGAARVSFARQQPAAAQAEGQAAQDDAAACVAEIERRFEEQRRW